MSNGFIEIHRNDKTFSGGARFSGRFAGSILALLTSFAMLNDELAGFCNIFTFGTWRGMSGGERFATGTCHETAYGPSHRPVYRLPFLRAGLRQADPSAHLVELRGDTDSFRRRPVDRFHGGALPGLRSRPLRDRLPDRGLQPASGRRGGGAKEALYPVRPMR